MSNTESSASPGRSDTQFSSDLYDFFDQAQIQAGAKTPTRLSGLSTGFKEIDAYTLGFRPGELVTIGGRPGTGKTALAVNLAINIGSGKDPKPVLFFSTDLTRGELSRRFLAAAAKVSMTRLHAAAYLQESDWKVLGPAAKELIDGKIEIFHSSWLSLRTIRLEIEKAVKLGMSPKVVIIDKFYSLILGDHPEEGSNNRTNEQSNIIVELKSMAKEFGFTAVLLADINKSMESKAIKRPNLVDLKDGSAAIESYSDQVLMTCREQIGPDEHSADLVIAKSRTSATDWVKLAFHGDTSSWSDFIYREESGAGVEIF